MINAWIVRTELQWISYIGKNQGPFALGDNDTEFSYCQKWVAWLRMFLLIHDHKKMWQITYRCRQVRMNPHGMINAWIVRIELQCISWIGKRTNFVTISNLDSVTFYQVAKDTNLWTFTKNTISRTDVKLFVGIVFVT